MSARLRRWDAVLLMLALPLAGMALAHRSLEGYLDFPPLTRYVPHAGFSWAVFAFFALLTAAAVGPFAWRVARSRRRPAEPAWTDRGLQGGGRRPFPAWGWAGLFFGAAAWVLAWTRFAWFAPLQPFTFSPLWLAYIVVVNALTQRRTGRCMLRDRPRHVLALAVLSAGFWWFFEYLNRFVQNWYYQGCDGLSAWQYVVFATLPFATVLPAVLGTEELLRSYPRLTAGLERFAPVRLARPRLAAGAALAAACAGLAGIGLWPDLLFPLLWLAPLVVITAVRALRGQPTVLAGIEVGDWRRVARLALAALACGFFWELWNYGSLARWVYSVPFVNAFHLFEMPLVGYAGYLPFGLECAAVAEHFLGGSAPPAAAAAAPEAPRGSERLGRVALLVNAALAAAAGLYFFWAPAALLVRPLRDPAWSEGRVPEFAWRLHRDLTPRYAAWARQRVASGRAGDLPLHDVQSTEWPMFGSLYYLWATERLQEEWARGPSRSAAPPREYAREAIEASVDLLLDPAHHAWVRTHWGPGYLRGENVFFRAMIIGGLTARENLLGGGRGLDTLRDQVDSLAAELDASPHGVLDDYPDECYPIDVLAAVACIRRADRVLGTDHAAFAARARRGFEGAMLDERGLIPYSVDARSGEQLQPSRGVGNSYALIFAPELWPEKAPDWYRRYEKHFWQDAWWASGFREFPRGFPGGEWGYDVDAGPILAGFSPAANAFGLAAAVVNGRLDHARTLACQVLAATWPLPDGSLLGPRLLSNQVHAPYLGEACLLFLMAQRPAAGAPLVRGGRVPGCVALGFAFYLGGGALLLLAAWRWVRRARRGEAGVHPAAFAAWALVLAAAVAAALAGWFATAALAVLAAWCLPSLRAIV